MRKNVLSLVLVFMFMLSACSTSENANDITDFDNGESVLAPSMIYDGVWPENKYTADLPVPAGTVSWVVLDDENGYCSINIVDVEDTQYQSYMEHLMQAGFSITNEGSEEVKGEGYVSIGTLLSDGTRGLSISFIPGNLGIYISFLS